MITALSSLSASMQSFIDNENGLGEEIEYYQVLTDTIIPARRVKEYKDSESRHRRSDNEEISDRDIFLVNINIIPVKNDRITYNGKVFFVDNFIEVAENCWRIYVNSDVQSIPRANARYEI